MANGKQGTTAPSGLNKDLNRLRYFLCEKKMFKEIIFQLFESQDDPYQYFLQLLPLAKSAKSYRPNKLMFEIISNFKAWTKNSPDLKPPSATHQKSAMDLAIELGNKDIIEKIIQIFQINRENDMVEKKIENGNFETFVRTSAVTGNKFISCEKLMNQSIAQSQLSEVNVSVVKENYEQLSKIIGDRIRFEMLIFEFFGIQHNPYQYFLELVSLAKSQKQNSNKPIKILSEIISCFEAWLIESADLVAMPSAADQESALDWAMNFGNGDIMEKISLIFPIDGENKFSVINEHLERGNLEMVARAVKILNQQKDYSFEQLYFPLLCFNLKKDLKNCLKDCKYLKKQFIQKMDELFYSPKYLDQAIESVARIFPARRKFIVKNKNHYWKAMNELLKEWNIPPESCENCMWRKRCGTISHLVNLRKKKEISIDALAEMIEIVVGNEIELKNYAIDSLKFDSTAGRIVESKLKNTPVSDVGYDNFSTDEYLQMSENNIVFVNDRETYERSIEDIFKFKEIGFDTESQPNFGWGIERIALLQIATWDNIYLFDVISLSECLSNWDSLAKKVFHNSDTLKIGYGIGTDLEFLKEMVMGNSKQLVGKKLENFMDLQIFSKWVSKLHPEIGQMLGVQTGDEGNHKKNGDGSGDAAAETSSNIKDGKKKSGSASTKKGVDKDATTKGLSGLCKLVWGKPLNKLERISDWERRPLRKAQKLYAALDAYCPLQIFRKMEDEFNKLGFDKAGTIQKFFKEMQPEVKTKKKKKA